MVPSEQKNEIIAAVLSLFFPGIGQIYCGQMMKGLALIAVSVFTCAGFGLLPFIAAFDAYKIAGRVNAGEKPGDWQFF